MFDQIVNDIASRVGIETSSVSSLLRGLLSLITNERTGGPEGFMERFREAGLGDTLSSWFGGLESKPITGSQVESALGVTALDNLASKAGVTRGVAASILAAMLPRVIATLTPHGSMPSVSGLLPQLSGWISPVDVPAVPTSNWPIWAAGVAAAALILIAWLAMRLPPGTIEPQLTVANSDGRVTYSALVRDLSTKFALESGLRSTFGPGNVKGATEVNGQVKPAPWLPQVAQILGLLKPGVKLEMTGSNINLGGWLSASDRAALTDNLRGLLGEQSTFGAVADQAAEAIRAANDKAMAALSGLGAIVTGDDVVSAMNLQVINFASGSAEIPADANELLKRSADALKRAPASTRVMIAGHTDNTGDPTKNMALSQARAEAVKSALIADGVNPAMLLTQGYGDTHPRSLNDTEYGKFMNRRIEYSIVK